MLQLARLRPRHYIETPYGADAALVGVTLVWGSTFIVVKDGLTGIGPFEFIALRFGIACLALALAFIGRLRALDRAAWRAGLIIGCFLFLGYAFQTSGLLYTTASRAGFITGLSVLIVPMLARAVLGQPVGRGVLVGIGFSTAGLWFLSADGSFAFGFGDLLVLGCAVAFAAHIVSISAYAPRHDPIGLAIVQTGVVAVLAGAITLGVEGHPVVPVGSALSAATYTGLLGSAAVLGIQTSVQRYTSASHAALIFSLEPVFAAIFAFIIAGERLGPAGLLGGALILAGMVAAELWR
ncbi:MAG TPA: DMT family transporter [Chloroflexota bacterium]|nr:DMT family transporter [Chloroflexota bacterium]